jgi:hypothetical protein
MDNGGARMRDKGRGIEGRANSEPENTGRRERNEKLREEGVGRRQEGEERHLLTLRLGEERVARYWPPCQYFDHHGGWFQEADI